MTPLTRASVERMMALCEKKPNDTFVIYEEVESHGIPATKKHRLPIQHILALCQHFISTTNRGSTAVRGEAVATLSINSDGHHGSASFKLTRWDLPLGDYKLYASPPATPVAAGGDGSVVSDAEVEAAARAYRDAGGSPNGYWDRMRIALEAAERTRNERASPSAAVAGKHDWRINGLAGDYRCSRCGSVCANDYDHPYGCKAALAAAPGGKS